MQTKIILNYEPSRFTRVAQMDSSLELNRGHQVIYNTLIWIQ